MVRLKAGDRVDCRVKSGTIVNAYNDYDEIRTFEIVAKDDEGYYLFVPPHVYLNGGSRLDASRCKRLGIDPRFIDETVSYISEGQIYKISFEMDGLKCSKCTDFFVMAAPNQLDGSFLCWSCRFNPYR